MKGPFSVKIEDLSKIRFLFETPFICETDDFKNGIHGNHVLKIAT